MKFVLNDFRKDEQSGVYLHPEQNQAFDYSDGQESEDNVYQVLKESKDLGIFSQELTGQITDWPTEYHFSPVRHNLLRHFQFKSTDKILELGCGCGAITRQLGETGASVIAVEGSFHRAKCAALRCRDLPNVKVYTGNFQDIDFENEFDYVTLIGVFEYCPMYFKSDSPESECLEIVKSALKPQGKLFLAIENRLGLKYFMGLEEDHEGIPFFGIQDLYGKNTAITFGKVELSSLLMENGFSSIEFQYPFPDYKIPKVIFTERAFHNLRFRSAEIIRQLTSRDYSNTAKPLFSENLVWPVLEVNKLIPELSNSFLVIAGVEDTASIEKSLLAVCYTLDRIIKYNIRTEFLEAEREDIIVRKSRLIEGSDYDSVLVQSLNNECYHTGKNMDAEIGRKMYEDDFEGYVGHIKQWIDFVVKTGLKDVNTHDIYESKVLPEFFDCVPINVILTPEGLAYIDREWKYMKDFTLTSLILRYLIYGKHAEFIDRHLEGSGLPCGKLLTYLGIKFNDEIYRAFLLLHEEICNLVYSEAVDTNALGIGSVNSLKSVSSSGSLRQKIKDRFRKAK